MAEQARLSTCYLCQIACSSRSKRLFWAIKAPVLPNNREDILSYQERQKHAISWALRSMPARQMPCFAASNEENSLIMSITGQRVPTIALAETGQPKGPPVWLVRP
jgi:hypothetical protein